MSSRQTTMWLFQKPKLALCNINIIIHNPISTSPFTLRFGSAQVSFQLPE